MALDHNDWGNKGQDLRWFWTYAQQSLTFRRFSEAAVGNKVGLHIKR